MLRVWLMAGKMPYKVLQHFAAQGSAEGSAEASELRSGVWYGFRWFTLW